MSTEKWMNGWDCLFLLWRTQVHCLTWASLRYLQIQLQWIQCSLTDSVGTYICWHVNKITFRYTHTQKTQKRISLFKMFSDLPSSVWFEWISYWSVMRCEEYGVISKICEWIYSMKNNWENILCCVLCMEYGPTDWMRRTLLFSEI